MINRDKLLYNWFLDFMPTDASKLMSVQAFFDLNTTMPTHDKARIISI